MEEELETETTVGTKTDGDIIEMENFKISMLDCIFDNEFLSKYNFVVTVEIVDKNAQINICKKERKINMK